MTSTLTSPPAPAPAATAGEPSDAKHGGWFTQRPVLMTVLLALAGALLLQVWRPYFFLTCDTLSAWLPNAVEAYRRMWEGRSPFHNDYLFGGFDLREEVGSFCVWSPWTLGCSFLAKTPYYFLIPDVAGTLSLMAAAGAFCWSALRLRRQLELPIQPGLIVALSLSYAFTPFNFLVGASWIGFLSAAATLPVLLAAAFERDWRRALAMQTAALMYALFGGHLHPLTVLTGFFCPLVAALSFVQRSWRPLAVWFGAGVLTLLIALPLLWPGLSGFQQTSRGSQGLPVEVASMFNVPLHQLIASFLLGPASNVFLDGIRIDLADPLYNLSVAFALVNIPLVWVLATKRRWNAVEITLGAGMLAAVVCIMRPDWLAVTFAHLPVLHSLRWPFREIAMLNFFAHALFLFAFRVPAGERQRLGLLTCGASAAVLYALGFLCAAPTFWLFEPDRRLITSGEADRYWNRLKQSAAWQARGGGEPRFVVEAPWQALYPQRPAVPFSLIGGFNYASLFRIRNVSGFSVTPPPSAAWLKDQVGVEPYFWGGIFSPGAVQRLEQAHPDIVPIVLTNGAHPTVWQVGATPQTQVFRYDPKGGGIQTQPLAGSKAP